MSYFGKPGSVSFGGTGDTTLTAHGVLVGEGTGAVTALSVGSNGQVMLGSTSADPAFATLTSTGGTITFTTGAHSLNLEATAVTLSITSVNHAASPYTVLSTDYFLAVDDTGGVVSILLPNAPATGRSFVIKDTKGDAATNNITVTTVGGVVTIDGSTSFVLNANYQSISVIFDGTSYEVY